jgi:hypothetical protein
MAVSEEKYQAALRRLRNMRQEGVAAMMVGVEALEVVGAGSAFSFADGYFGKIHAHPDGSASTALYVLGAPFQLLAGGALHAIGALGVASEHMHALGNGAFVSATGRMAYESGIKARAHHDATAPKTAGASGSRVPLTMSAGRRSYSDAELERIARGAA